jgi:hypothetical protein
MPISTATDLRNDISLGIAYSPRSQFGRLLLPQSP